MNRVKKKSAVQADFFFEKLYLEFNGKVISLKIAYLRQYNGSKVFIWTG